MRSSNYVDFSIRQNKTIERGLVFNGLRKIAEVVNFPNFVFVGFGAIWFIDFRLAHKELGIETMFSIEGDPVLAWRARFNAPYRTVEVLEGMSQDKTRALRRRRDIRSRPWLVWLDYDEVIDLVKLGEFEDLVGNLPPNSILLTTFRAEAPKDTSPKDLTQYYDELLGDAFPSEDFPSVDDYADAHKEKLMKALADAVLNRLSTQAVRSGRSVRFVPMFNMVYEDSVPMATVGGMLTTTATVGPVEEIVQRDNWPGFCETAIAMPPLTQKEVGELRKLLPALAGISRSDVRTIGFDLEDAHLARFVEHYLYFPTFMQTAF